MNPFDIIDATWPPIAFQQVGPFRLREGGQGGQRVSAATCARPVTESEIAGAEDAMASLGQAGLFMVQGAQPGLDDQLDRRGYRIKDPTIVMTAPIAEVAGVGPPLVSAYPVWPALAIQYEIWEQGGIGPARTDIMQRARGPKTTILGRSNDTPAGTAYAAIHGDTVMMHAVEVAPKLRRLGTAVNMTRAAATWGISQGASQFAVLTVSENLPAQAVYSSLGLRPVEHYHYRVKSLGKG